MYLCRAEQNGAPRAAQAGRSGRAVGGTFSFFGRKRNENGRRARRARSRERGYSDTRGRSRGARSAPSSSLARDVVAAKSARGASAARAADRGVVS